MHLLFAALALDALFSSATLSGAHAGALVVDAQSGKTIYARNADDAFTPASTMKLIVGSAALERLGESFSFTTRLTTDGTTLYLEGGGDPLLSNADAQDAAASLAALQMTSFPGGLRGDAWHFRSSRYPDGWQIDDLPYDYAAPVDALSFEENALHITLTPATRAGDRPTASFQPDVTPECFMMQATTGATGSKDTTDLQTSENVTGIGYQRDCTVVEGSIPLGSKPVTLDAAALQPAVVALDVFARAFSQHGITAELPAYPNILAATQEQYRVVWTHASPRLPDLLRDMWQPSDNLLAETLLQQLGAQAAAASDTRSAGIAAEEAWLQTIGIDPKTLTIADGSGMSAYDRVTPHALVTILAHDWNSPQRATVLAALPVAGKSGTLEHTFDGTPLAGNVIAKTGTSNHTRTLAGYLQTPHGTLIFALLVNDWMDPSPNAAARLHAFQHAFLTRIREGAAGVP